LLAFSDSVQDAAHRAGFFGARTYRFNFRAALQQYVAHLPRPLSLAEIPQAFCHHYQQRWDAGHYLTTLMPPDMVWLDYYDSLLAHGRLPDGSNLPELLTRRIAWEITSEYAFRSRIGRTLDVHFISSLPVIRRSACKAWGDREPVQIVVAED